MLFSTAAKLSRVHLRFPTGSEDKVPPQKAQGVPKQPLLEPP